MTPLLAAMLLAAQASAPPPVPLALEHFMERAEALDGRWVEFDAYVILLQGRGPPILGALTGETRSLRSGRRVTMCADDPEAGIAVLLARNGMGPLRPRAAQPRGHFVGVRIRGILRQGAYGYRNANFSHEWVGSVDHARIVRVTGGRCLISSAIPADQ